jgi:hypothetical protein
LIQKAAGIYALRLPGLKIDCIRMYPAQFADPKATYRRT